MLRSAQPVLPWVGLIAVVFILVGGVTYAYGWGSRPLPPFHGTPLQLTPADPSPPSTSVLPR